MKKWDVYSASRLVESGGKTTRQKDGSYKKDPPDGEFVIGYIAVPVGTLVKVSRYDGHLGGLVARHLNAGVDVDTPLDEEAGEAGEFRCPGCAVSTYHGLGGVTIHGTCQYCGEKVE